MPRIILNEEEILECVGLAHDLEGREAILKYTRRRNSGGEFTCEIVSSPAGNTPAADDALKKLDKPIAL